MADDKNNPEDNLDTPGDSGLGNLPPLSDFDSGGMDSDGGLPPLGNFDSGGSPSDSAGLPPISDIQVETPQPTGGNVRRPPFGFDSAISDTFSSGTPGIDTPAGTTPSEGLSPVGSGFQDLAADSDFSPETPEIGPGPDSNMDTPMFDSAFGGGSGSGFGGSSTGAPTQAMETPMFGQAAGGRDNRGFDAGAFGGGATGSAGDFGMGGGTPAPDFSPDTDMRAPRGMGGMNMQPSEPAGRGGGSPVALIAAAVIALIAGVVAGPYVASSLSFLPNPLKTQYDQAQSDLQIAQTRITQQEKTIEDLRKIGGPDGVQISPERLQELQDAVIDAEQKLKSTTDSLATTNDDLAKAEGDLATVTDQFVTRRDEYEDLSNQLAITEARQRGLVTEVDRLTNHVGELQEAAVRSDATKDALAHAVDRLYVQVKEGLPLTPAKYDRAERLAEVESLRSQIGESKWVTPALQDAYTGLYLKELQIAQSEEYFYSKIPVIDQYGTRTHKWAECVMQGNHEVVYRSFDGQNIGVFTNLGTGDAPAWGFSEDFSPAAKKELEARVMGARVEGFEEKIQALAERQLTMEGETGFQKAFSSL